MKNKINQFFTLCVVSLLLSQGQADSLSIIAHLDGATVQKNIEVQENTEYNNLIDAIKSKFELPANPTKLMIQGGEHFSSPQAITVANWPGATGIRERLLKDYRWDDVNFIISPQEKK